MGCKEHKLVIVEENFPYSEKHLQCEICDGTFNLEEIFRKKIKFHKKNAKLSFEEKFKQILELQKIEYEIRKDESKKPWKV